MGIPSISMSADPLKKIYENETSPSEIIVFITTPGVDPSEELRELAHQVVGPTNYRQVSVSPLNQFC
jgi:dynein heavy chain 2